MNMLHMKFCWIKESYLRLILKPYMNIHIRRNFKASRSSNYLPKEVKKRIASKT